jgi:hypothetical protein
MDTWEPQDDKPTFEKDVTPAQPEAVTPGADSSTQSDQSEGESDQEGVQVGGLAYVPNLDGTRHYQQQEPVETEDDPTPTPAEDPNSTPDPVAENTSEPVGR